MHATQSYFQASARPEIRLSDDCGYAVNAERVRITVGEIANDRPNDNLSGTLAIELWALKDRYEGGAFDGVALAGTTIGQVAGQHHLLDCRYDLNFNAPPVGAWQLCLMLREWDGNAYVTRDHANFPLAYEVAARAEISRGAGDNVINLRFPRDAATETAKPAARPAAKPAAKPAPKVTAQETEKKTTGKKAAKAAPEVRKDELSLNRLGVAELAAIKGISHKLAERIVAHAPFKTWDDVLNVKGVGRKLLDQLRNTLDA